MPRSLQENLALYAAIIVREGLALAAGQELLVYAETGDAPFVQLVAAEAYRAGAKNVEVLWTDPELTLTRFREGSQEAMAYVPTWLYDGTARAHRQGAARLAIASSDPSLLADVPPERVATQMRAQAAAKREIQDLVTGFAINWCLVGAASERWAARVFPRLSSDEAVAKLWDAIFLTARVHEPNPIAAWVAHSEQLEQQVARLNELRLDALHFRGPGTDLRVGLVENHRWGGGRGRSTNGILCSPNIPTEEVFTMPHRARVEGTVQSTKALSLRGQIVDGITVEFKRGEVVSAKASKGEETLQRLLATDDGARRLGEVALVPHSSLVSRSGVLFYHSLYDENAASHIAFGMSYAETLAGYAAMSPEERLEAGANASMTHIDWMIGSAEVNVDGTRTDGSVVPLMRAGEWV